MNARKAVWTLLATFTLKYIFIVTYYLTLVSQNTVAKNMAFGVLCLAGGFFLGYCFSHMIHIQQNEVGEMELQHIEIKS